MLALGVTGLASVLVIAPVLTEVRTRLATAIPTAAAATAPAGGPAEARLLSERYGLIEERRPPVLRSETASSPIATLRGEFFRGAVSPDGRKIAYWETPMGPYARVLWLLDAALPAEPRILLTLPDTEAAAASVGSGVAWSSEGTGLLIAVNSVELSRPSPPVDATPRYSTLRQVDIATGAVREIARNEGVAAWFEPIAWDRARGISAAVDIGPGGFVSTYVVLRDGAPLLRVRLAEETLARYVRAAPDASRVLMRGLPDHRAVYVWPLAEPTRLTTLAAPLGEYVVAAMWGDAGEIVVSLSRTSEGEMGDRLEVWRLDGSRRMLRDAPQRLDAVRPDGTAAITDKGVIDLRTGVLEEIPGLGRALASVLLR